MASTSSKGKRDAASIAKRQLKNRANRLERAVRAVCKTYASNPTPPAHHWYLKVIARAAGFTSYRALVCAITTADEAFLSRFDEKNPEYSRAISLSLADNFGVEFVSSVQEHFWRVTPSKSGATILPPIFHSGQSAGLGYPASRAQLDEINRSHNRTRSPKFEEEFGKEANDFFRIMFGKPHETDLVDGRRSILFQRRKLQKK